MKILKANAGPLTNFEVLDFIRNRGAEKDPSRVIASIAPSEFTVYDYLLESAAGVQTRESIQEFMTKSEKFALAKAETLNIINIRPSSRVEIDPIIEKIKEGRGEPVERLTEEEYEELVNMVVEVLPGRENPEGMVEDDQKPVEEKVEPNPVKES